MKTLFIALIALVPTLALAGERKLSSPEWIFDAMSEIYPEFKEHIGGFSYEFDLSELSCSSTNVTQNDRSTAVQIDCMATTRDGRLISRQEGASRLYLTLINGGADLDRASEPGTTYIILKDVSCGVIEPRSSNPDEVVTPEYFCSAHQ